MAKPAVKLKEQKKLDSASARQYRVDEITGIANGLKVGKELVVQARSDDGKSKEFRALCRIDTPAELDYYRHGGILEFVLRQLLKEEA